MIDGGGTAGIRVTGATSGVTVDGFTVRDSGTPTQPADGIEAFSGGSGFTVVNNVITQTTYGINMSSLGAAPSTVAHNRFDTDNRSGDQGGSGVSVCCGPGTDLSIADNLLVGGGTTNLQITRNVVGSGAATGIRVTNAFGPANVGLAVTGNQVVGRQNGVRLSGQTSGTVRDNVIASSTAVGILLDADNSGVTVTGNRIGSSPLDCRDDSTGARTLGTADTWTGNVALRSTPRGICGRF